MFPSLVIFLAVLAASHAGDVQEEQNSTCLNFGPWLPWTQECLWYPVNNMRQAMVEACNMNYNFTQRITFPLPPNFSIPKQCGYCSFKFRCHKRAKTEGCMTIEGEKKVCTEHSDVCALPLTPKNGCQWSSYMTSLKSCLNTPKLADWKRTEYLKLYNMLPESNCIQVKNQCKCCCHPFVPSPDRTRCVEQTVTSESRCPRFGSFNEWSQCLWFPLPGMIGKFAQQCGLDVANELPSSVLTSPSGQQFPEKCGFCSFRTRCQKRNAKDGCYRFNAEKKICGGDDCATCGDTCRIAKFNGTCSWSYWTTDKFQAKLDQLSSPSIPYYKRRGTQQLINFLPKGTCKDMGDHCKCCCFPYVPSEDGSSCILHTTRYEAEALHMPGEYSSELKTYDPNVSNLLPKP